MATEGFGQRLCVSRCWFILMPGVTVHTRAFPSAAAQHWPPVGLHYSLALRVWLPCSEHKGPSRRPSISSPHPKDCRFGWILLQSHPQDPSLLYQLHHHSLMPQNMWQAAAGTILEARTELYGSVILSTTRAGCWPQPTLSCH